MCAGGGNGSEKAGCLESEVAMPAVTETAKANVKRGKHEWYEWYKEHGICVRCRKLPAEPGRVMCNSCMRDERRKSRERSEARKAYYKERRQGFIAQGLCGSCGKAPPLPGRKDCATCTANRFDSRVKSRIKKRTRLIKMGLLPLPTGREGKYHGR